MVRSCYCYFNVQVTYEVCSYMYFVCNSVWLMFDCLCNVPVSWYSDPLFTVTGFQDLSVSIFMRWSQHCFHWPVIHIHSNGFVRNLSTHTENYCLCAVSWLAENLYFHVSLRCYYSVWLKMVQWPVWSLSNESSLDPEDMVGKLSLCLFKAAAWIIIYTPPTHTNAKTHNFNL